MNNLTYLLESFPFGFFAVNRQWKITYCNKGAEQLLMLPRETIVGELLWTKLAIPSLADRHSEFQKAMDENVPVTVEEYVDRAEMWLEISAYPAEGGLSVCVKDITERRLEAEKLKESAQHLQLFTSSPVPKWIYDHETFKFMEVNDAAVNHYGYSTEEFLSMTVPQLWPKGDCYFTKSVNEKIKQGLPCKVIVMHLHKSGRTMEVQIDSRAFPSRGSKARLVVAVDITEKLQAERTTFANEQRFLALTQYGTDLTAILDPSGTYRYVGPSFQTVLGIPPSEFIEKNAFDFVHPADRKRVQDLFDKLTTNKRTYIPPFRFRSARKKYRWIEAILTDCTTDPTVGGVIVNSRDVTHNIINNIKIKEHVDRFNLVSKTTSDVVYDWDLNQNRGTWNKGIKGIFGHKQTRSVNIAFWFDLIHPDDRKAVFKNIKHHIRNKKARWRQEYRFRCADGSYRYVLDRGFFTYNHLGKVSRMLGALQDITERVMHLQAIEEQNKRLQEIAWIQSHVVRAPLARIMGLSTLIQESHDDQVSLNELLAMLQESTNELDTTIREIISKTEKLELQPPEFRITENET